MLRELALEDLMLHQIMIVTLNEKLQKMLVPQAPSTEDRIIAIDKAVSEGITEIIRYQPLILGIVEANVDEVLGVIRDNNM